MIFLSLHFAIDWRIFSNDRIKCVSPSRAPSYLDSADRLCSPKSLWVSVTLFKFHDLPMFLYPYLHIRSRLQLCHSAPFLLFATISSRSAHSLFNTLILHLAKTVSLLASFWVQPISHTLYSRSHFTLLLIIHCGCPFNWSLHGQSVSSVYHLHCKWRVPC